MKNKLLLLLGFFLIFSAHSFAQQSLNASGGNTSSSSVNISFSVGQVFSKSISNASNSISEGVHQPFEISTLGVDNNTAISLEMKIYPNPTTSKVFLKNEDTSLKNLDYQIFDASGRLISKGKVLGTETPIDLSKNSAGTYLLIVSDSSKKLKTFKIIKN